MKLSTIVRMLFNEFKIGTVTPSLQMRLRIWKAKLKDSADFIITRYEDPNDGVSALSIYESEQKFLADMIYGYVLQISTTKNGTLITSYGVNGTVIDDFFPTLLLIQGRAFQIISDEKARMKPKLVIYKTSVKMNVAR